MLGGFRDKETISDFGVDQSDDGASDPAVFGTMGRFLADTFEGFQQ